MTILNTAQIREWDRYTMQHEPIRSIDLMERAAAACTGWIMSKNWQHRRFRVFCGKGNNGGDGLAIARLLMESGIIPHVYILEGQQGSPDYEVNLQRLYRVSQEIEFLETKDSFPEIEPGDVVVDALFGSGLNRPLLEPAAELVAHINQSGATVVSIDLPSGMFMDRCSAGYPVVKARYTLSFQSPKLCFMVSENAEYVGDLQMLDIGLHEAYLQTISSTWQLTSANDIKAMYRPRKPWSHKGHHGHALVIGGAIGKTGAALLATEACLRTGAGLTSVYLLSEEYTAMNSRCPEAMTVAGNEMVKKNLSIYTAVAAGPGMGKDDIALHVISMLLDEFRSPLVFDADAINIIAAQELLQQLPQGCILTPHPKEFDRLFGEHPDSFRRFETALKFSAENRCVVVLKGHRTLVAVEGMGYFNSTGNAGLAKGGSGDVLTGIIVALLAQGYTPGEAARMGVYLHGLAADLALDQQSQESMLGTDLLKHLGQAFKMVGQTA